VFRCDRVGMATHTPHDIVNIDGLAQRLKLSKAWLHREAIAGRIPSLIAGKRRLFNPPAVEAVLAQRAARGTGEPEGSEE